MGVMQSLRCSPTVPHHPPWRRTTTGSVAEKMTLAKTEWLSTHAEGFDLSQFWLDIKHFHIGTSWFGIVRETADRVKHYQDWEFPHFFGP